MFEEQQPNEVEPTDDDTRRDGNKDRENQRQGALRLSPSRPTYTYFYYPVYTRDKEKEKLHKKTLFVEPLCHKMPPKKFLFDKFLP